METLSNGVRVHLANYFANLPVPNTVGGIFKLSVKDWISFIPLAGVVTYVSYVSYLQFCPKAKRNRDKSGLAVVNPNIQKEDGKVVHSYDIEDLGDKAVLCRCWRSKKFPYCDGSHNSHNIATGDNVGPVILKKKGA